MLACPAQPRDRRFGCTVIWELNLVAGEGGSPAGAIRDVLEKGKERGLPGRPRRALVTDLSVRPGEPGRTRWHDVAPVAEKGPR